MNPANSKSAEKIFFDISKNINNKKNEVIICPPYPFLFIKNKIKDKKIKLGSQDVFFEKSGSFTGEVSPSMLLDFGVSYTIVGHSERRSLGENNLLINKKIISLLKSKIRPILCVGETDRDHNGFYLSFIKSQIEEGLKNVPKNQIKNIIIAYEPLWAIGKEAKREATPKEFIEIKIFIKKILSFIYGPKIVDEVSIIYGGSVNSSNASSFIKDGDADGLLVGRDSLLPLKFLDIVKTINK